MKKNDFYSRYVSTHYQYVTSDQERSFRKRFYVWKSFLLELLPRDKNSPILEIGAGVGHNLYSLKTLGFHHVTGTDYSPECVNVCRRNGYSCQAVTEKTEKKFYSSHKKSFDMVILYDVLEHYTPNDAVNLLQSIKSMLKDGGSILVSLPNASHPLSNTLFFADITHKFIYNEISLSQLFRNSGFTQIRFKQMNSFTTHDDDFGKRLIKTYLFPLFSSLGEWWWKLLALSQGIMLTECKPTLVAVARI